MIDTVTLKIIKNNFQILKENKLDGLRKHKVQNRFEISSQYCKKYRDQKKREGQYFPVITVQKGRDSNNDELNSLEIQVSLPKLIYGTNLYEIDLSDLDLIYQKLLNNLLEIGIKTDKSSLQTATIKRIDFSKVIRLPAELGTANQAIKKISEFDIKQSSKVSLKEYSKEDQKIKGISFKFLNTTQGYAIYSKFGEILANGYTEMEKMIIQKINLEDFKDNAIRFEFSLQQKKSVNAELKKFIHYKKQDFYLYDVIKDQNIARQILLNVFDKIFQPQYINLLSLSEMNNNLLEQKLNSQNLSIINHSLLHYLAERTTKIGVSATFEELKAKLKGSSFDRYKKKLKNLLLNLDKIENPTYNLIQFLRKEHNDFKLIKLVLPKK